MTKQTITTKPIAVLIDAENMLRPEIIDGLLEQLGAFGAIGVMRLYGHEAALEKWKDAAMAFGLQPMLQFNPAEKKNATDFALTIDAMDLLHSRRFGGFCLVTSDADFIPLVRRLRAEGLPVYNCGEARKTVKSGKAYTHCITIESLLEATPKSKPPAKRAPVVKPKEVTKKAVTQNRAKTTKVGPTEKPEPSKQTLQRIGAIIKEASEATGKLTTQMLGHRLAKNFSEFSCKKYGHATLGKFLAAHSEYFELSNGDTPGQIFVQVKKP